MSNEPVTIGAAIQGVLLAVGGLVTALVHPSPELNVAILGLAGALGVVANVVHTRPKVTPKAKTNTMGG